ncbi:predicted protein [Nematostella vectensis]|uniref:Uncharacterized protein n=1 Tax=Nematostella vectensis TaxID=45351 RepID=A7T0I1_NEMVE|nr:predicted protein [Nematostella vectensis]|eukprot:XP_001622634.1 predicted protein [Nematostella vectensis]
MAELPNPDEMVANAQEIRPAEVVQEVVPPPAAIGPEIVPAVPEVVSAAQEPPVDRLEALERKLKALEDEELRDNMAHALALLRRYLDRPLSIFDKFKATELLQALVRSSRRDGHAKAEEYAGAQMKSGFVISQRRGADSVEVNLRLFKQDLEETGKCQVGPTAWCDIHQGTQPFVGPIIPPSMKIKNPCLAKLDNLRFRRPNHFKAGSIHEHQEVWDELFQTCNSKPRGVDLAEIVREGVKVEELFTQLKETLKAQHVRLHSSSESYFGVKFRGYYFTFLTLLFGWKASAFVYHNLGMTVSDRARDLRVPVSQYIDDRHVGHELLRFLCLSISMTAMWGTSSRGSCVSVYQ